MMNDRLGSEDPCDGQLDFSAYSAAQLGDLERIIDRNQFPLDAGNLQTELARRREGLGRDACADGEPIRFSVHDGWRGWLEAKRKRAVLYGAGAIEIDATTVQLWGWRRTWLGMPLQEQISLPLIEISNVAVEGNLVHFERVGRMVTRRYEVTALTPAAASQMAAQLPTHRSAGFEQRWLELQIFKRRLAADSKAPWVTRALVAVNFVIFIAFAFSQRRMAGFAPQTLTQWGADFGPLTAHGEWWRLVSAMFMHLSVLHVLINMWALWNIGRLTERLYGTVPFLALYMFCGIMASLSSVAWQPQLVTVGASGAIFGIFGAFLAFLKHRRARVPATIARSYFLSTAAFVAFSLIQGFMAPEVDNAAHVGGLISGFVFGWFLVPADAPEHTPQWPLTRLQWVCGIGVLLLLAGGLQIRRQGLELSVPDRWALAHSWYVAGAASDTLAYTSLLGRLGNGSISPAQFAGQIRSEIVPFWRDTVVRLNGEEYSSKDPQASQAALVLDLTRAQVEFLNAFADGVEAGDANIVPVSEATKHLNLALARVSLVATDASASQSLQGIAHSSWMLRTFSVLHPAAWHCLASPASTAVALPGRHDLQSDGPAARAALACTAQRSFLTHDFVRLDARLSNAAQSLNDLTDGSSSFDGMLAGLNTLFESKGFQLDDALKHVADWRRQVPGSIYAQLIEAMLLEAWAWDARGPGFAAQVTQQGWIAFSQRLALMQAELEQAAGGGPASPLWYRLSIDAAVAQSFGKQEVRSIFDRGHSAFPNDLGMYRGLMRSLMPRWGGSFEEVDALINSAYANASGRPNYEIYARLYAGYASMEGDEVDIFVDGKAYWNVMLRGFQEMQKRRTASDYDLNLFANFACRSNDAVRYQILRPQLEGRYSSTAWTAKFSLDTCDHRLVTPQIRLQAEQQLRDELVDERDQLDAIIDPLREAFTQPPAGDAPLTDARGTTYEADLHRLISPDRLADILHKRQLGDAAFARNDLLTSQALLNSIDQPLRSVNEQLSALRLYWASVREPRDYQPYLEMLRANRIVPRRSLEISLLEKDFANQVGAGFLLQR